METLDKKIKDGPKVATLDKSQIIKEKFPNHSEKFLQEVIDLEKDFEHKTIKGVLNGDKISLAQMKEIATEFSIRFAVELPLIHIKNAINESTDPDIIFRLKILATFFQDNSKGDFERSGLFYKRFTESQISKSKELISKTLGDETDSFYEALEWLNEKSHGRSRYLSEYQIETSNRDPQIRKNLDYLSHNFPEDSWIKETLVYETDQTHRTKYWILVEQKDLLAQLKTIMREEFDHENQDFDTNI